MFGLMKARSCSQSPEQKYERRLHYCGACKTMGTLYGQKARLLLNNDAVFLGELLSALSAERDAMKSWARAYQSYNCMSLPGAPDEMPLSLQFAATATVVMSDFKVADQIEDSGRHSGWRVAQRLYGESFRAASNRLESWGLPVTDLWRWYEIQNTREHSVNSVREDQSSRTILDHLAEPTATVTGLVFQQGAKLVGCSQQSAHQTMYRLGYEFGRLVYTLDAYEDYEKDHRRGDFNALQAAYGLSAPKLPEDELGPLAALLSGIGREIESLIDELPLPEELKVLFVQRLQDNLRRKLGDRLQLPRHACQHHVCKTSRSKGEPSLSKRWNSAVLLAKSLTERTCSQPGSVSVYLAAPFVFLSVLGVAFLFPNQALSATSYRDCMDVALNLMFVTAALSSLAMAPFRLLPRFYSTPAGGNPGGWPEPPVAPPPGAEPGGGPRLGPVPPIQKSGGGGCCCGCDDCDCCCDCGDCCEGCGGCGDCCSGCGDCGSCCDC
jgi:hypothetical protein